MTTQPGSTARTFAAALLGAAAMGALVGAIHLTPAAEGQPITMEPPAGAPLSFADLIDQVSPAVVSVNVISEREIGAPDSVRDLFEQFRRRQGQPGDGPDEPETRQARSLGSGFFISGEGYVVTNNHVIADATEIELVLSDGRELEAELVGTDPQTDLAVLKVEGEAAFPYVEFANTDDLRVGDWVVALGNPFGLGGTATAGIVSADGRELGGNSPYTDFLQIDAPINRGNSGGPTFDLNGRVIGVNTAIFSPTGGSVGIGFAIPAELATQVTNQLIKSGRVSRGWLGVSIQDLTDDMAEALGVSGVEGAIVSELVADGPALKSGIERGDVIVAINGREVGDATEVTRAVGSLIAGSTNAFEVLRDGSPVTIDVTVGERPDDVNGLPTTGGAGPGDAPDPDAGEDVLGVRLTELDDETRRALGLDESEGGALVDGISRTSPLYEGGVREGMAILEVSGERIDSQRDFEDALESARRRGRDQLLIAVRAGRRTIFVPADISETE